MIRVGQIYRVNTRMYSAGLYLYVTSLEVGIVYYQISVGLPISGNHKSSKRLREAQGLVDRGHWILVPSYTRLTLRRIRD